MAKSTTTKDKGKTQTWVRKTARTQFNLYPAEVTRLRALCDQYNMGQTDLLRTFLENAEMVLPHVDKAQPLVPVDSPV